MIYNEIQLHKNRGEIKLYNMKEMWHCEYVEVIREVLANDDFSKFSYIKSYPSGILYKKEFNDMWEAIHAYDNDIKEYLKP